MVYLYIYLIISIFTAILYISFFKTYYFKSVDKMLTNKDSNNFIVTSFIPIINILLLIFLVGIIIIHFIYFIKYGGN